MLSPKKIIPPLAVAALPLIGTGCGDDSSGGATPAENLEGAFGALCVLLSDCFPQYYSSPADCVAENQPFIDFLIEGYTGPCLDAYAALVRCWSGLSCEEYVGAGYYACADQFDPAVVETCGVDPVQ